MVQAPLVSVIIPVYNVAPFIERCVRSLMEQTLQNMEFIFVDDCTPDESTSIIEETILEYPQRQDQTIILHHERNRGLPAARNTGLANAHGEYIVHCDSDDFVDAQMYEKMYRTAKLESADIVLCDFNFFYSDHIAKYKTARIGTSHIDTIRNYLLLAWPSLWNMMAKREVYEKNNLHSPEQLSFSEDFWLGFRLLFYSQRISIVPEALYNYNQENRGSIIKSFNPKCIDDELTCYLEMIKFFKTKGVYDCLEDVICWRILKNKQFLACREETFEDFLCLLPEANKYISSCPTYFCSKKNKVKMWLISHKLQWLLILCIKLRTTRLSLRCTTQA